MKTVVIVEERIGQDLSSIITGMSGTVRAIRSGEDIVSLVYMDPPDLIFIDRSYLKKHGSRIIDEIRSNTVYGHLPIIAVYKKEDLKDAACIELPVDDYLVMDHPKVETRRRIEFISRRAGRHLDTNPLTRLPGNARRRHPALTRAVQCGSESSTPSLTSVLMALTTDTNETPVSAAI